MPTKSKTSDSSLCYFISLQGSKIFWFSVSRTHTWFAEWIFPKVTRCVRFWILKNDSSGTRFGSLDLYIIWFFKPFECRKKDSWNLCDIHKKCRNIKYFFFAPWFLHGGLLLIICFIGSPHIGHTRNGVQPFIKQHRNHIRSLANYRIYYIHILKSPNLSLFKSFKLIYLVTDVFLHYSEHYFIYTEC